jgi:hypothetical protein
VLKAVRPIVPAKVAVNLAVGNVINSLFDYRGNRCWL